MQDLRNKYLIKHQVSGIQMFPLTVFIHLLLNQTELAFSL